MTFLELVQRLFNEAAIEGTSPATVTGQTGMAGRCVNWIQDAYKDIQGEHWNWDFLEAAISFATTSGNREYSLVTMGLTDLAEYKTGKDNQSLSGLKLYKTSVTDEQDLLFIPWEHFNQIYNLGSLRNNTGRPVVFSIGSSKSLHFWPTPDDAYTVSGRYYKAPSELSGNDDTPIFDNHHMVIVWRALMFYSGFEESASKFTFANNEYMKLLSKLERDRLPMYYYGAPLS